MNRKLAIILALLLAFGLAFAQIGQPTVPVTLAPTVGDGPDAVAKGATEASVQQWVRLTIPQATALHLDVTEIIFDLTNLDGPNWPNSGALNDPTIVCVYGPELTDQVMQLGADFWNQVQTLPLGLVYEPATWPNIRITNSTGHVTAYPPIRLDENGELIPNSKNYFVCFKSFIIQKFSNFPYWDLTVTRDDATTIQHLYIQDNTCKSFFAAAPTGFYELNPNQSLHLIPKTWNFGPTARNTPVPEYPEACRYKSWLDDLVVLAVKINVDNWGTSSARLTYTLTSSMTQF